MHSALKRMSARIQKRQTLEKFSAVRRRIVGRLEFAAKGKADFWDFRDNVEELASKKLFQYPAMMVPALQKQVMAAILKNRSSSETILDPFLGSGTILVQAMLNGRSFIGQDINPLAILIAKTRAYSLDHVALSTAVEEVIAQVISSRSNSYFIRFVGQSKWFTAEAAIALSRLRKAIKDQASQSSRRFLWVCLAETIRLNSNSRTSTFKLHIKPEGQRNATLVGVLTSFSAIARRNVNIVKELTSQLKRSNLLDDENQYIKPIKIVYGNSANSLPVADWAPDRKCDLVVTSPPYGDNRTTVPYGQAAWLPLKWIDISDIDSAIPRNSAERAYDIDNRSLGGDRQRSLFLERRKEVAKCGPLTRSYLELLDSKRGDGISRFVHFAFDISNVLKQIALICNISGKVVMTLGHRNISQTVCPLTDVCAEIFSQLNLKEVVRIDRHIPSKRMPDKNAHSATINHEYISIFHKSA